MEVKKLLEPLGSDINMLNLFLHFERKCIICEQVVF